MCQALLEIMEPEINKIKEEIANKERQKGIKSLVIYLRDSGQSDIGIKNALIRVYDVSISEAESYL